MRLTESVKKLTPELIELRRDLHMHPELGFCEHRTAGLVESYLKDIGVDEIKRVAKTGVLGLVKGETEGPTLMLRADMDALPVEEENTCSYRSKVQGCMHACGHDGHTAVLLVVAKLLCANRHWIKGNVKLCFQPNEEGAGALPMIDEGALDSPKVEACLGLHLWCPLEIGTMAVDPGPVMAGMHHFHVTIKGKGGHTAMPQQARDPLLAAVDFVQKVQSIQAREIDPLSPTIIVFGSIKGGTGSNIKPGEVLLEGTVRYLYDVSKGDERPLERLERILKGVCETCRVQGEISYGDSHPALINDHFMTNLVRQAAEQVFPEKEKIKSVVSMAGEDFSEFASRAPSAFYFVGAGNREKGIVHPHHHPKFDLDEDSLALAVLMQLKCVKGYFSHAKA
jgi:amidohydrolase